MSFGSCKQAADDLDALALAGREGPDRPIGLEREPVAAADLVEPPAHRLERGRSPESATAMFSATVSSSKSEKCWNTMPMPRRRASTGEAMRTGRPSQSDFAGARLDDAVEDLDEGRLAGAVLAEQRVDLAAPDREVDAVIGEEPAVALGDAAERDEGSAAPVRSRGHRITGPSTSGDASSSSRRAASSSASSHVIVAIIVASSPHHARIMSHGFQGCMMVAPVVSRPSSARWTASASLQLAARVDRDLHRAAADDVEEVAWRSRRGSRASPCG